MNYRWLATFTVLLLSANGLLADETRDNACRSLKELRKKGQASGDETTVRTTLLQSFRQCKEFKAARIEENYQKHLAQIAKLRAKAEEHANANAIERIDKLPAKALARRDRHLAQLEKILANLLEHFDTERPNKAARATGRKDGNKEGSTNDEII